MESKITLKDGSEIFAYPTPSGDGHFVEICPAGGSQIKVTPTDLVAITKLLHPGTPIKAAKHTANAEANRGMY